MGIVARLQPRIPTSLSVQLKHARRGARTPRTIRNVSVSGIACTSDEAVPNGELVTVGMQLGGQTLQLKGIVVWCKACDGHFELGLRFEQELLEARMKMCRELEEIEHYRHEVLMLEGRQLSSDAAALEWMGARE